MLFRKFEGLKLQDSVKIHYTEHTGIDYYVKGKIEWISDMGDLILLKGDDGVEDCIFETEARGVVVIN